MTDFSCAGAYVYPYDNTYYTCPACTFYNGYQCVEINQYQDYQGGCDPTVRSLTPISRILFPSAPPSHSPPLFVAPPAPTVSLLNRISHILPRCVRPSHSPPLLVSPSPLPPLSLAKLCRSCRVPRVSLVATLTVNDHGKPLIGS